MLIKIILDFSTSVSVWVVQTSLQFLTVVVAKKVQHIALCSFDVPYYYYYQYIQEKTDDDDFSNLRNVRIRQVEICLVCILQYCYTHLPASKLIISPYLLILHPLFTVPRVSCANLFFTCIMYHLLLSFFSHLSVDRVNVVLAERKQPPDRILNYSIVEFKKEQ